MDGWVKTSLKADHFKSETSKINMANVKLFMCQNHPKWLRFTVNSGNCNEPGRALAYACYLYKLVTVVNSDVIPVYF